MLQSGPCKRASLHEHATSALLAVSQGCSLCRAGRSPHIAVKGVLLAPHCSEGSAVGQSSLVLVSTPWSPCTRSNMAMLERMQGERTIVKTLCYQVLQ